MTEEIAATPGWVDTRLDQLFATLPASPEMQAARDAYAACLGQRKAPAAISDQLGAEFADCRSAFLRAVRTSHEEVDADALGRQLEALEAEIDAGS